MALNQNVTVALQLRCVLVEAKYLYVVRYLNRNLILGLDWLKQNNVRIYFDLKFLGINVNLVDVHFASTYRKGHA